MPLASATQSSVGAVDLQHVEGALAGLAGADAVELAAQDLVDAVGEHDGE